MEGDNVIPYEEMPATLNIYAYGNFDYNKVDFDLSGPYSKKSTTDKFPYALYENEGGFPPFVGRYTLTVKATNRDSSIVTNSIQFSISYGDSLEIAKNIEEWSFYPNPTENVINIKLPSDISTKLLQYSMVNIAGQKMALPSNSITTADHLTNINLDRANIPSGIYFIRVESEEGLSKVYKIFKK